MQGRQIDALQQEQPAGAHTFVIGRNELQLAKGVYLLSIRIGSDIKNYKLVVN